MDTKEKLTMEFNELVTGLTQKLRVLDMAILGLSEDFKNPVDWDTRSQT